MEEFNAYLAEADQAEVARPAVSQHLAKPRLGGLVSACRAGRRVWYAAHHGHIRRLVAEALHASEHQVSGAPDHH